MTGIVRYIPNTLTGLRLAAVPAFAWLMLTDRLTAAMWVFLAAEATDVLDGVIARRFQVITAFGKVADPAADKIMQLTALFLLAWKNMIPVAIPWLFLAKELVMLIAGVFALRSRMDTSARWYGKAASVLLFATIMLTFFLRGSRLTSLLMWGCVAFTLFALVMYGRSFHAHRSQVGAEESDRNE